MAELRDTQLLLAEYRGENMLLRAELMAIRAQLNLVKRAAREGESWKHDLD